MLYRTVKAHLNCHVEALSPRPTGSLWDYVPEPRLPDVTQPLPNDICAGRVQPNAPDTGTVEEEEDIQTDEEKCDDAKATLKCLGCGRFMHKDDVYPCMYAGCRASPFHLECIELHYERAHPLPQQKAECEGPNEEDVLTRESVEARSQWVDQMTNLSKISMPLGRKLVSAAVVLVSMGLAVGPFWSPAVVDTHVSFLQ